MERFPRGLLGARGGHRRSRAAQGLLALALLLPGALLLSACTDSYRGSLRGNVQSEEYTISGTPIPFPVAGAFVNAHSMKDSKDYTTETDENGDYYFPDLPFGLCEVLVSKEGFTPEEKYADIENQTTTVLDFKLPMIPEEYTLNLGLLVLDDQGAPVSGATVDVYRRTFHDYGFTDHIDAHLKTGITDENGRLFMIGFDHLLKYQVGVYRIDVVARGFHDAQKVFAVSYDATNLDLTVTLEPVDW
jgi:hypothetical protein